MKIKLLLLVILSMMCICSCRDPEEITKDKEEKMLEDYMEMLRKDFNLIMNKGNYYVREEQILGGNLIHNSPSYVLYSYDTPKYKSEFFYNREKIHVESPPTKFIFEGGSKLFYTLRYEDLKEVPFFNKTGKSNLLLEIIDSYGLRPYLWSQLIYDKSKGNDFEKIEEILKRHGVKYDEKLLSEGARKWACGIIPEKWDSEKSAKILARTNTVLTVIDEECGNQIAEGKVERLKIYGKKFEEYFSKVRHFEEIDWYEFMKFNNIHPIILINVIDFPKEKVEKIRDEIKPYYNYKDFTILFCYWIEDEKGYEQKYVW